MYIAWSLVWIYVCHLFIQPCIAELKLIQTVFRHGNRYPTKGESFYPNDPYITKTYRPEGPGDLTNTGKMSSYKLGQYLRDRYDEFLGPLYSKEIIWFCANNLDRIIMTAELVAAGMYPPHEMQRWNPRLDWQPIPIWPPPDYLYSGSYCKNFYKWRNHVEKTDEDVIRHENENREVYAYLSKHAGGNITQHRTFSLRQILYAQRDIGLKLPEWTKPVFPNGILDELAVYDVLVRTRTLEMKQLLGGIWIREWLKHVDNYLNQRDTRKAFMYAAHEFNIAFILVVLDNFDNQIPSYSSTIMFELHEDDNEYFVQILHKNEDNVRTLKIPGCDGKMCPLDIFRNFTKPIIPEDPAALCESTDDINNN